MSVDSTPPTFVWEVVRSGDTEQLRSVLQRNSEAREHGSEGAFDVNTPDADHSRTLLHVAASHGDVSVVQLLLSFGADVNAQDSRGNTPLHVASLSFHPQVVSVLLASNTDPLRRDAFGRTAVDWVTDRVRTLRENITKRRIQFADDDERDRLLVRLQHEMGSMIEEITRKMEEQHLTGCGEGMDVESREGTMRSLRSVQEKVSTMSSLEDLDDIAEALERLSLT